MMILPVKWPIKLKWIQVLSNFRLNFTGSGCKVCFLLKFFLHFPHLSGSNPETAGATFAFLVWKLHYYSQSWYIFIQSWSIVTFRYISMNLISAPSFMFDVEYCIWKFWSHCVVLNCVVQQKFFENFSKDISMNELRSLKVLF